jgi:hypothetical protein
VSLLAHSIGHDHLGNLAGGLALLALGVTAAAIAAWLLWIVARGESSSAAIERRRRFWIVIPLAWLSEAGLLWLAATAVRNGRTGLAWSLGGLALIVLLATIALLAFFSAYSYNSMTELLPSGGLIALSEASLGWLTVDFAGEGGLVFAGLLGGLALALLLFALLMIASSGSAASSRLEFVAIGALFVVPVASLGAVAGKLAVDGRAGFALLVGGVAIVGLLVSAGVMLKIGSGDPVKILRGLARRAALVQLPSFEAAPPGGGVSLLGRLAGLSVALGTVAWAAFRGHGSHAFAIVGVLAGVAGLSVAAAVLLLLQGIALTWLRPGSPAQLVNRVAADTWQEADDYLTQEQERERDLASAEAGRGSPTERERYYRERMGRDPYLRERMGRDPHFRERMAHDPQFRERMERDPHFREFYFGERMERDPHFRERMERDPYLRERMERDPYLRDRITQDPDLGEYLAWQARQENAVIHSLNPLRLLARPLDPPAAVQANVAATRDTGLVMDTIWPQMQLVVPPQVQRDLRRQDRKIASLRLTAASALTTAGAWAFLAEAVVKTAPGAGMLTLLLAGPLVIALFAVLLARPTVVEAYLRRGDAVRTYRFDLAKAMHLPLPATEAGFIALARTLTSGLRRFDQRLASYTAEPGVAQPDLSGLGQNIAASVSQQAVREVSNLLARQQSELSRLLGEQHQQLSLLLPTGRLSRADLTRLAEDIAQRASDPVSAELIRHFAGLQGDFNAQMREAIKAGIEETVLGPPLTNFTGYLMIGLDTPDDGAPPQSADGVITAPPGQRVRLVMSVVRDVRASAVASVIESGPDRPFFIVQPVVIEGGRTDRVAEFNAIVDSASLTPLPQRKNMRVGDKVETTFAFRLPAEEGQHEAWFQLYQAGRLIQVVAVRIDAKSSPAVTE